MKKIKKEIIQALKFYKDENKDNLSITAIANKFNIAKKTLFNYIRDEDYLKNLIEFDNVYYHLDETEYKAINEYLNTNISFAKIKEKYGYKSEIFKKKLEVLGYSTDRKYKLNYNRDKLKEIKTEEDAYILGFILADGYINENINMLRIKLQEKDLDILQKFCDYFQMDYSFIKYEFHSITGNKQYYLSIYDKDIIDRLKSYGLHQNKSCKEVPYYDMPKHLIRHYIRGIWDGDGFIRKNLKTTGVCGSEEVLTYIYNVLNDNLDLILTEKKKINPIYYDKNSNIYRLEFSQKNIYKIINYLYKNSSIYLNRKYALYKQLDDIMSGHE